MMYNNKLVVAIKANGRVLREFKDGVYVPYGSEYSILIKNLNSVRAVVNITIDGQSASGTGLAIEANTEVELERFLKSDLNKGNRFKFIERTGKIEKHRGVKLEDGLIRVEFQFAKPTYTLTSTHDWYHNQPYYRPRSPMLRFASPSGSRGVETCNFASAASFCGAASATMDFCDTQSETGITVAGSESNQRFREVAEVPMEHEKHVMVMRLLGETQDNKAIREPVTVKYYPICKTCGTKNKVTNKFCIECGTALHIHS